MNFRTLYGGSGTVRSAADKTVEVTVPALSSIVLRADKQLGTPAAKPTVTLKAPAVGATGTVEISADVDGGDLNRVVFAAQTGDGKWTTLGSADHAPYKVTQHLDESVKAGTALRYKAVVVDRAGRTTSALASTTASTRHRPPRSPSPSTVTRRSSTTSARTATTRAGSSSPVTGPPTSSAGTPTAPSPGSISTRVPPRCPTPSRRAARPTAPSGPSTSPGPARSGSSRARRARAPRRPRPRRRTPARPSCTTTEPTATTTAGACTPGPVPLPPRTGPSRSSP